MMSKLVIELLIKNPRKPGDSRSDVEAEQALAESVTKNVVALIEQQGYVFIGGGAHVAWLSKEDMLRYTPRKKHMWREDDEYDERNWLCRTEHVSKKNLVTDPALVTCKLCLAVLKEQNEAPSSEP